MQDILTITLNPAVDLSTTVDMVRAGPKLRCARPQTDPGGGGINVSRAIQILGGQSRALVAVGGPNGKTLRHMLLEEGIACLPFRAPGPTRQSLSVTDKTSGAQYRFVMPGPEWNSHHKDAFLDRLPNVVPDDGLVVLSGSLPPGVPDAVTLEVQSRLQARKARIIADVSGAALAHIAKTENLGLFLLRMDQHEAETLNLAPLASRKDTAEFARALVARGLAQMVIVARGADGSVMATAKNTLHVRAPEVPVKSKTGAGDSFVGAFTLAIARGVPADIAFQHGSAAASAAVMTDATQLCTRLDAERLYSLCTVTQL